MMAMPMARDAKDTVYPFVGYIEYPGGTKGWCFIRVLVCQSKPKFIIEVPLNFRWEGPPS
jgi:hypothetical protein